MGSRVGVHFGVVFSSVLDWNLWVLLIPLNSSRPWRKVKLTSTKAFSRELPPFGGELMSVIWGSCLYPAAILANTHHAAEQEAQWTEQADDLQCYYFPSHAILGRQATHIFVY